MNKFILRNTIRNKLKAKAANKSFITNINRLLISYRLLYFFKQLYKKYYSLQQSKIIGIYYPLYYEINCLLIARWLEKLNVIVVLPKIINNSRELVFYEFNKKMYLCDNLKGIKEPVGIEKLLPDTLIVPLIAYDFYGVRLGQGGGYYDYTISKLSRHKKVIVIGAAYSWQSVPFIPSDSWDINLDAIITEKFYKLF